MDIKEIMLTDEAAQKVFKNERCNISADLAGILARALIESYKAELLKEVGEPVAFMCSDEELCHKGYERFSRHNSGEWNIPIFTSDQVAAAILKATKPMIEERDRAVKRMEAGWIEVCDSGILAFKEMNDELRAQLAAAQEEIVFASKDSLRLLETVKYLRGIAERGEVREQSEDETVEQFVLGYVKKLEDQLAKAEQRVAEACALQVATETRFHWLDADRVAKEIRSGEWRKFMKEV